jgi:hypothetical protein
VTTNGVLDVVPSVVVGNAVLFHVIVNVEGWVVVGVAVVGVVVVVVEGVVLLEQPIVATMSRRTAIWAGRTVEYIASKRRAGV